MRIFTYYEPLFSATGDDQAPLVKLWQDSWRAAGWDAQVLTRTNVYKHPDMADLWPELEALPSINPPGYDLACYLRWLAVGATARKAERVWMSDYDVLNYGHPPEIPPAELCIYTGRHIPALVSGLGQTFTDTAFKFAAYDPSSWDVEIGQRPHCSDQEILSRHPDWFSIRHLVREYGAHGWRAAYLVHYATSRLPEATNGQPKYQRVCQVMKPLPNV